MSRNFSSKHKYLGGPKSQSYYLNEPDPEPRHTSLKNEFSTHLDPSEKLQFAVLLSAIRDLRYLHPTTLPYTTAVEWLMSDEIDYVFSFASVCTFLGLNHLSIRLLLKREGVISLPGDRV